MSILYQLLKKKDWTWKGKAVQGTAVKISCFTFAWQPQYLSSALKQASPIVHQISSGSGVKNLPAMQETQEMWVRSLGQEDLLEKVNGNQSSILTSVKHDEVNIFPSFFPLLPFCLLTFPDARHILFMPLHHRKEKLFAGKIGESYINKFLWRLIFHFLPYQCRGYGGNKEVTCFETALKVSSFLCKFQNYLFLPY